MRTSSLSSPSPSPGMGWARSMKNLIVLTIFLGLVLGIVAFVILIKEKSEKESILSETEKELIESWIIKNDLNQHGDPEDTVYMGGTPLFDEKTGESIDKYEYILRKHPDRPWLK